MLRPRLHMGEMGKISMFMSTSFNSAWLYSYRVHRVRVKMYNKTLDPLNLD